MASKSFERLRQVGDRQTLRLTHYGRKSGRPYEVTIWYLLDGDRWENSWKADRYEPNPFGGDDSVVVVE